MQFRKDFFSILNQIWIKNSLPILLPKAVYGKECRVFYEKTIKGNVNLSESLILLWAVKRNVSPGLGLSVPSAIRQHTRRFVNRTRTDPVSSLKRWQQNNSVFLWTSLSLSWYGSGFNGVEVFTEVQRKMLNRLWIWSSMPGRKFRHDSVGFKL